MRFAATCATIENAGYACMVCSAPATGHVTVQGGPHEGRCLAVLCRRHGSEVGYDEFKVRLIEWMMADLLAPDGGPGPDGAPEVWHRDHLDPLPSADHGEGW